MDEIFSGLLSLYTTFKDHEIYRLPFQKQIAILKKTKSFIQGNLKLWDKESYHVSKKHGMLDLH